MVTEPGPRVTLQFCSPVLTFSLSVLEVLGEKLVLSVGVKLAVTGWVPAALNAVEHCAVPPVTATDPQPVIGLPASLNATVPATGWEICGDTVAVNMTV